MRHRSICTVAPACERCCDGSPDGALALESSEDDRCRQHVADAEDNPPHSETQTQEGACGTSRLCSQYLLHGLPRASCRRCVRDEYSKLVLLQLTRCCKCLSVLPASLNAKHVKDRLSLLAACPCQGALAAPWSRLQSSHPCAALCTFELAHRLQTSGREPLLVALRDGRSSAFVAGA